MKKLIIVVDMLNGFTKFGPLSSKNINAIIPNIKSYLINNKKYDNIFLCDFHSKNDIEMKEYPLHCLANTEEAKIVDELVNFVKEIVNKNSTNGIFYLDLEKISKYDSIEIVGCCTDICVLQLALSLKTYFNKLMLDKNIIVLKDLVATFDSNVHDAKTYHSFTLSLMRNAGIIVK